MARERKSSKKLEGGPKISGDRGGLGKVKVGYSVPQNVLKQERTYGASSYHKNELTEVRDIIANSYLHDSLVHKLQRDILSEEHKKNHRNVDWRNKAYLCRTEKNLERMRAQEASHWTKGMPADSEVDKLSAGKLKVFDGRSKSLLPPISSMGGTPQKLGALKMNNLSPKMSHRSGSIDALSSGAASFRRHKQDEVESYFKKMDGGQQQIIIDKIHSMRLRAFEKRQDGDTGAKPYI